MADQGLFWEEEEQGTDRRLKRPLATSGYFRSSHRSADKKWPVCKESASTEQTLCWRWMCETFTVKLKAQLHFRDYPLLFTHVITFPEGASLPACTPVLPNPQLSEDKGH